MSDFPSGPGLRPFGVLGTWDPASSTAGEAVLLAAPGGGSTWPAANRALYIPVMAEMRVTVFQMATVVTTQSGNVDVGIYAEDGTKLVSSGSTAVAAAGVQTFDITNTTLSPGGYYLAMAADNATAAFQRVATGGVLLFRAAGLRQQASAFALPSTATFANVSTPYVPWLSASTVAAI